MFKILEYAGHSVKGRREQNEDNFVVFNNKHNILVAAVADGMGGHYGGRVASQIAIKAVQEAYSDVSFDSLSMKEIQNVILQGIKHVQKSLLRAAFEDSDLGDMGTTLNINFFHEGLLITANCGDSRTTEIHNKKIHLISEDQNLANYAKKDPALQKYKDFKNYLLYSLGPNKETKVDINRTTLVSAEGYIMVTSDGVHNFITDEQLIKLINSESKVKDKIEHIIEKAFNNNSNDNMTCILVKYGN